MKTYDEQLREHITFLQSNGLDVTELQVSIPGKAEYVRCRAIGETTGRGEYCYQTVASVLNNGSYGLSTICRHPGGERSPSFRTYGLPPSGDFVNPQVNSPSFAKPEERKADGQAGRSTDEAIKKSQYIWRLAKENGRSDYLERKGVGAYGIRFLENEYGRVAVIPARDPVGNILALEFLNPNGGKRFLNGSSWKGLFHMLRLPVNGQLIGIAESYATAATCLELVGIPVVCAFNAGNLSAVARSIHAMFPASPITIFADNDRHLESRGGNLGVLKAREALNGLGCSVSLSVPDFGDLAPSKEASDWNDLVRLKGADAAKAQIAHAAGKLLNIPTVKV
jgi:putative DNA primase/helicase